MLRTLTVSLLFAAAAACGGKSAPATSTAGSATPMAHEGHEGHDMEHMNLSPEMKAFHDLLAPRWHADKGDKRTADTCAAVPQFQSSADAVAKATPPVAANADTWTAGTRALVDAVAALAKSCSSRNAGFDDAFTKVHESFHGLMMQGEMHGEGTMNGSGGGDGMSPGHGEHEHHHEH